MKSFRDQIRIIDMPDDVHGSRGTERLEKQFIIFVVILVAAKLDYFFIQTGIWLKDFIKLTAFCVSLYGILPVLSYGMQF